MAEMQHVRGYLIECVKVLCKSDFFFHLGRLVLYSDRFVGVPDDKVRVHTNGNRSFAVIEASQFRRVVTQETRQVIQR